MSHREDVEPNTVHLDANYYTWQRTAWLLSFGAAGRDALHLHLAASMDLAEHVDEATSVGWVSPDTLRVLTYRLFGDLPAFRRNWLAAALVESKWWDRHNGGWTIDLAAVR